MSNSRELSELASKVNVSSNAVGIDITPSTWGTTYSALQISRSSIFTTTSGLETNIATNAYYNNTGYKYIANGTASQYSQLTDGSHRWSSATTGTAGGGITFVDRMTLSASGNVGIGAAPNAWAPSNKALQIVGATSSQSVSVTNDGGFFLNGYYDGLS